jgi:hypothetical protein
MDTQTIEAGCPGGWDPEARPITRAVIVTSVVAIVAALGTGLAVVTAGIGPAIPLGRVSEVGRCGEMLCEWDEET